MKGGFTILSAMFTTCVAIRDFGLSVDLSVDIPVDSKIGHSILSKARRLEDEGESEDGDEDEDEDESEDEDEDESESESGDEDDWDGSDYTWLTDYSIKFKSCHSVNMFVEDDSEDLSPSRVQHLVSFNLCPKATSCKSCKKGGEYIVQMNDFVESYLEVRKELQEAACETAEENCNCNYYYGDDETCLAQCYKDAGLSSCAEDEFDVVDYMGCAEAQFNNYYYGQSYYIGPVCHKGSAIYLNMFKDASCTVIADTSVYEDFNNGESLPYSFYSKQSIVDSECMSCQAPEDENEGYYNYYQYRQPEAIQGCGELYQKAGKCEKKMKEKNEQAVDSCNYIHQLLPALERVYKRGGGSSFTTFLLWVFVFLTFGTSCAAYYFHSVNQRGNINLPGGGGSRINGRML